jgi:hypothetical protein
VLARPAALLVHFVKTPGEAAAAPAHGRRGGNRGHLQASITGACYRVNKGVDIAHSTCVLCHCTPYVLMPSHCTLSHPHVTWSLTCGAVTAAGSASRTARPRTAPKQQPAAAAGPAAAAPSSRRGRGGGGGSAAAASELLDPLEACYSSSQQLAGQGEPPGVCAWWGEGVRGTRLWVHGGGGVCSGCRGTLRKPECVGCSCRACTASSALNN